MYSRPVRKVSKQDVQFDPKCDKSFYSGSLKDYISFINANKKPLHNVLGFKKEINGIVVEIALQWYVDVYSETMLGYANNIRTIDGGTHVDGVKASITRTLNRLAKKSKVVKEQNITFSGEHVREGLTCIVSVIVPNPEFEGQIQKKRLGNQYVREIVDESVEEYLTEYFELHPNILESIISKSFNAYKTDLAFKKAREVYSSKIESTLRIVPEKLSNNSSENS
ncbi:unnamed protein product, partial [Cochlearia groenlandica]